MKQTDPLKYLEGMEKFYSGDWPTLTEMFQITLMKYPDKKAFTGFYPRKRSFTYREVDQWAGKIAGFLKSKGIEKGDKIGLTGKNSPEWALCWLAILYAGAVAVPVDYQLKKEEIAGLFKRADVKLGFSDHEALGYLESHGDFPIISLSEKDVSFILNQPMGSAEKPVKLDEKDMAIILFTSGTTGVSKGVMLSHKNLVSDAYLAQYNMNIFSSDVFYALLPIHHSYTMLAVFIESLSVGAECIFGQSLAIGQILKEMKQGKVTMFLGVPLLFNKMIKGLMKGIREKGIIAYGLIRFLMGISGLIKKITGMNPGKLMFKGILANLSLDTNRICISGGGPLPASTFTRFNQLGIDFVQGYGLTETSPILTLNPVYAYVASSVGKTLPQIDYRIDQPDEDGIGEICVRGPNVMMGYYQDEAATAEIIDSHGWLHTGDMGYLDKKNYLYLTGRCKNLIVTEGGKNVFPEEIEDGFQLYDEIEQILVRGYQIDAKMKTEGIEALIFPSKEEGLDCSEERIKAIIAEVNKSLVSYKRIQKFEILTDALEMTTTKKIKRK